jgi:glycolate oxidase FAD binding subunit
LQSERLVFRITLPRAEVFNFIPRIKNWHGAAISVDAAIGTVWLTCQANKANASRFAELTEMANSRGGHVIIFAAPSDLKHGLEVWGLSPPTLALMRRIKHQFDPAGLLNPGRFVGSL